MRLLERSCMIMYYKYFLIYRPKRNKIQVFFSSFFVSRTNKKNIYPPNGLKIHSFFCPCIWQGFLIGKLCDFWALEAPEAWMYRQFEGEKTVKRKKRNILRSRFFSTSHHSSKTICSRETYSIFLDRSFHDVFKMI